MANGYQRLYQTVSEFVDDVDDCMDSHKDVRLSDWYMRLNRCLDLINREQSGIPEPLHIGRPLGARDKCKRKLRGSVSRLHRRIL